MRQTGFVFATLVFIILLTVDQCQAKRRPCGFETIDRNKGREPRALSPYYDRCCGDRPYDPRKELCCGLVVKKKTGSQNACCGVVPYDSSRYTCCGGTITPRASGHQHLNRCCGKRSYNPYTHVCCGGIVLSKPAQCCGNKVYNGNKQICCSNVLLDKPSGIQVGCCGRNVIFASHQMCCARRVVSKPHNVQNPRCCGTQVYSSNNQVCCSSKVRNGNACCGSVGYNSLTHSCCGSVVTQGSMLSSAGGTRRKCCGQATYYPDFQDCCFGRYLRPKGCCYNNNQWRDSSQKFSELCRDY